MKVINVNKLTSAGCRVKIWIADWFAQLNNKMGGDLKKIKVVGQYLIEIWKAVGMDLNGKVEFLWSSDEINSRASEYWPLVMDIARRNKLPRITRCGANKIFLLCFINICSNSFVDSKCKICFLGVVKLWAVVSKMSCQLPKFFTHVCSVLTYFSLRCFCSGFYPFLIPRLLEDFRQVYM